MRIARYGWWLIAASALLGGCSARYAIMTAPAVSMTAAAFPEGHRATEGKHVDATYCQGDEPVVSKDSNIGLFDEAIMLAQQQAQADYLRDVTIWADGGCIAVEGTAMTVMSGE